MTPAVASVLSELTVRSRERGSEISVATMTIAVFFEDAAIGALARDRIRALAAKHPSRVIVLDATADEALHRVDTKDWIELGVKTLRAPDLAAAVGALRLREAPVVLCWIAPGIGNDERFCALSPDAQTVVYNSSLVDQGHEALCELVDYVQAHPDLALADIAYLRLGPWQECVAAFFDGEDAEELLGLHRVEIGCGSEPEAFYLLGWLASRLAWEPQSAGSLLNSAGEPVAFEIRREGDPRRIRSVVLKSARSSFAAELDEHAETISLRVTGGASHPQRYRPVHNLGIAALVERAILSARNDRIFRASLAAAGEILSRTER